LRPSFPTFAPVAEQALKQAQSRAEIRSEGRRDGLYSQPCEERIGYSSHDIRSDLPQKPDEMSVAPTGDD
jgi:hypothetical protein